ALPPAGKQEDALLPKLEANQALDLHALEPTQHFTQPPPRFTEATLIKALEKENIGRPSTYAPIIQTIQARLYVEQKERRFFATDLGMLVTDLLVEHFPTIMDLKFTAHMEDELDDIATAKEEMVKVLDEFYHPFQEALKQASTRMQRVQVMSSETCQVCGAPMVVKFSKSGQFLGCSKYPECKATRQMDGSTRAAAVETEHICTKCGKPLMLRESKRGPFLSCSGYPTCKESFSIDAQGNPVPSVVETEHVCEKCGKPMALRQGSRGNFLGCTGYPKCRN
ncbi:DNA topoisomerase, partial [Singulisphaera rosea]